MSLSPRRARAGMRVAITVEGCVSGGIAVSMAFRGTAKLNPIVRPGGGSSGTVVISSRVPVGDYDVYVFCTGGGSTMATITVVPSPLPPIPPNGTIDVTPMYVRPGDRVDLRSDVCHKGATAVSPAFAGPAHLKPTADGPSKGSATITKSTPPGTYQVFAECDEAAATGTVVVVDAPDESPPPASTPVSAAPPNAPHPPTHQPPPPCPRPGSRR